VVVVRCSSTGRTPWTAIGRILIRTMMEWTTWWGIMIHLIRALTPEDHIIPLRVNLSQGNTHMEANLLN
jgi:hypothetical protein